jgi:hypothetical protein
MTRNEMLQHLTMKPFEPFRIRMNNGETYDIKHPENVQYMVTDSLYISAPVDDQPGLNELLTIAHVHNICTIEKPIDCAA